MIFFRLLILVSLLLVACSIHTPSNPVKSQRLLEWHSHRQLLSALKHYEIYGTFAYLSRQQRVYTNFNWQQINADHYQLILINPFSSNVINLNVQKGIAQFIDNQGKCYISNNPISIIQKLTGMSIPFNELRQWMLGLPGNATDFTLNSKGYLYTLNYNYNGQYWNLIYRDYHDDTVPALPLNLELQQGDNLIKLKMNNWNL